MDIRIPTQDITLASSQTARVREQPLGKQLQLEPGQLLKAVVTEAGSENRFLLKIGESFIAARSEISLQPGQTLELQVVTISPQIELKRVYNPLQQFLGKSLGQLGKAIDLQPLMQSLNQNPDILASLNPQTRDIIESFFSLQQRLQDGSASGEQVKQLMNMLGLSMERQISRGNEQQAASTLKAALLSLLNTFGNNEQLRDASSRLIATLELFQLSQLQSENPQNFILPLPFSFIEKGYLLVQQKPGNNSDGQAANTDEHRFSLHLSMSDIGNIRVDFLRVSEGLFIRFHTDSKEKADFVAKEKDALQNGITDVTLLGLSFAADIDDPAAALLRHILPKGNSVLDTTI